MFGKKLFLPIENAIIPMKKFFWLFLIVFLFNVPVHGQDTLSILKRFSNDETLKSAPTSIYVQNVATGKVILSTTPQLCLTPASVLKLITTATALEVLGNDFRFRTTLRANGEIVNGTLHGNLVIKAGGDPTLGSGYFNKNQTKNDFLVRWANQIKQHGIDTITGNIVVDQSIYSDNDVPQTWIWEDLGNYFGAAAQGIAIYDNTFELVFKTGLTHGSKTEIIDTIPFIPGLILQNEVIASDDNRDLANVFGSPFDSFRIIRGSLPKNRQAFKIKASIPDPADLLAYEFEQQLHKSGITVNGHSSEDTLYDSPSSPDSLLMVWESPTLAEIIKPLNQESINLFAEHLCKHIGYVTYGNGSTNSGVKTIIKFWAEKGIDTNNLYMADGSGLSRVNAITAKTLVEVLIYMHKNSLYFNEYLSSIPLTGLEGTQQYYFQDSVLKGKANAKSGSMNRVRSFAGYMTTQNGTPVAYAIMVNNFSGNSFIMAKKMEKLMDEIYLNF